MRSLLALLNGDVGRTTAAAAAAPVSNSKILIDVRLPTFLPSLSLRSHTEYSGVQNVRNCDIARVRSSRDRTHPLGAG